MDGAGTVGRAALQVWAVVVQVGILLLNLASCPKAECILVHAASPPPLRLPLGCSMTRKTMCGFKFHSECDESKAKHAPSPPPSACVSESRLSYACAPFSPLQFKSSPFYKLHWQSIFKC